MEGNTKTYNCDYWNSKTSNYSQTSEMPCSNCGHSGHNIRTCPLIYGDTPSPLPRRPRTPPACAARQLTLAAIRRLPEDDEWGNTPTAYGVDEDFPREMFLCGEDGVLEDFVYMRCRFLNCLIKEGCL